MQLVPNSYYFLSLRIVNFIVLLPLILFAENRLHFAILDA
jgi:hypothetical protein